MNIGRCIQFGDTIGIVAPSGPDEADFIQSSVAQLEELGFKVKEGKHIYDTWGYLAGRDEDRAADVMAMFEDDEVDMVLCLRGGYGAMRILPHLNFDVMRRHPKVFMGYSDITTLLNTFVQKSNLITFHGPVACSNLKDDLTVNHLLSTVMRGTKPYTITPPPSHFGGNSVVSNFSGTVHGQLVGGNLCLISSLLATPYEIDLKDKILLIEDVGESPYRIDRMLTQLTLAGKLQQCKGFIIGYFTECEPTSERSFLWQQVIEERILSLEKPTLQHVSVGHDYPNLTLPIGAHIELESRTGAIQVLEPVVYRA